MINCTDLLSRSLQSKTQIQVPIMDHKFKPWLKQIIKTLKIDGVLDSTDITGMIISNYESVEELFEQGIGSHLVAQLLTEDVYDCENENEDGKIEDFEGDEDNPGELSEDEYDDDDPIDDDEDDDEEENIDNQTSETDEDDDESDNRAEDFDISYFETRFVSIVFLKSLDHKTRIIKVLNSVFIF
jgi:hypothetical protein